MGRMIQCVLGFVELRRRCGVSAVTCDKDCVPIVKFLENREQVCIPT
jgi:hypothetical protein